MTLWRLEVLRLIRTNRWMILFGAYVFFAILGPLTARYLNEILARFGGDMQIIAPDPRPVDGIIQFVANVSQIGLLAVAVVAAAALAFDARPELAAFLRTRVSSSGALIVPRYVVMTAATIAALVVGTAIAWALSVSLIGPLPAGPLIVGTVFGAVYLAFAVAAVAFVAGFTRSVPATVFGSLLVLLALPIIGLVPAIQPWLPSQLLTAVLAMLEGAPAGEFVRSIAVSVLATALLLLVAIQRLEVREL